MKARIGETTVQFDERERSILSRWEKVTKKIAESGDGSKNLKKVASDWRQLAKIASEYADLVDAVRRRGIFDGDNTIDIIIN